MHSDHTRSAIIDARRHVVINVLSRAQKEKRERLATLPLREAEPVASAQFCGQSWRTPEKSTHSVSPTQVLYCSAQRAPAPTEQPTQPLWRSPQAAMPGVPVSQASVIAGTIAQPALAPSQTV